MNVPRPGDVVRLDGEYDVLVIPGERAVIDGTHYEDGKCLLVFHASAFRGDGSSRYNRQGFVSCSGGPCPLVPLDALEHVGTTERLFWKWKSYPQAGGGEHYATTVNLWSWKGRQR